MPRATYRPSLQICVRQVEMWQLRNCRHVVCVSSSSSQGLGRRTSSAPYIQRRILHTNHAQTWFHTQTMLKLYPAHKPCSNCILHTNYAQTVSCSQITLRLYPAHKPHSDCILHTNHTQTLTCKQITFKLYPAHKLCSNCILHTNHAQTVYCK